jgi:hypothetical protein
VQLGPRQPSETVTAGGTPGAGASGGNTLSVQQVGEESLKAGQPVSAQTPANGDSKGKPAASSDDGKSKTGGESPDPASSSKKKGKFHFLKKVVKPF